MSQTRYTNKDIREFLIKVVSMALTNAGYTETSKIPVIVSHQNTPAPKLPYVTVGYSGITTRQGHVTKSELIEFENEELELNYKRYYIQDVEKVFTLTEEGGTGSLLELIADSMEMDSIRAEFETAAIALLRIENVSPRPQLFNEDWQTGATLDIVIGVAAAVVEIADFIEDVQMSGELKDPE